MTERPQNKYIVGYQYKPKYTAETIKTIKDLLDKETNWEDIFPVIKKMHPDVSPMSVYRWVEKVASGKLTA